MKVRISGTQGRILLMLKREEFLGSSSSDSITWKTIEAFVVAKKASKPER
jgi:hypothetical protein